MRVVETCGCFPTGRHYPGIAHLFKVQVAGLAREFAGDGAWVDYPIAFLDTETTGIDARVDRVIEVGLVVGRGGEVTERKSWLVNPGIPIPQAASDVHGITDDQVADLPPFASIVPELLAALEGCLAAAYNAAFDRGFIFAELERAGVGFASRPPAVRDDVDWIDPLVFAREIWKGKGESRALGAVAARLGIALERAHRATDDAEAALRVLYAISADPRVPRGYAALIQEQRRLDQAKPFWRK
ncbi:MAG: 3'-5' exonuclease [Deltaproteobacteria bacterium]|nr:3'-5' exonuclease [Deltaproteobacteria bacterium]